MAWEKHRDFPLPIQVEDGIGEGQEEGGRTEARELDSEREAHAPHQITGVLQLHERNYGFIF